MYNCCVNIVQLNCQRSNGVLCDVGRVMSEKRVSVTLLQEFLHKRERADRAYWTDRSLAR